MHRAAVIQGVSRGIGLELVRQLDTSGVTVVASIELGRRARNVAVIALHPGTVRTNSSEPFQGGIPDKDRFDVDRAARQLLGIVRGVTTSDSGQFFAWDGTEIPW